jgi:hypothetical protein
MGTFDHDRLNEDILERIREMEADDFDPGPKLDRRDLILAITVCAVCIIGMIWGLT